MSDNELLQRYVRDGANDAFATLAGRYVDLVYSVARRHVGPSLAEDVTQAVFIELARHARRIKPGTPLVAWLHVVSRRLAANAVRDAARRASREQEAALLNTMKPESSDWRAVEPLLDEAVASLPEPDRTAILLRFFQNKPLREVGAALGISDDAAQKRVTRSVERLRAFFVRRGILITAGGLAAELSAHVLLPAPVGLLAAITTPSILLTATPTAIFTMTTLQKSALVAVLAGFVGWGAYELSAGRHQREGLASLEGKPAVAHATAASVARHAAAAPALGIAPVTDPTSHRIAVLKQLLAELPAQNLPEIRLLDSDDWLTIAREHELDRAADIRVALAELRAIARRKFAQVLQETLRRYTATSDGRWPDTLAPLVPFLTAPADAEMLARYEITETGKNGGLAKKFIREKATSDLILTVDLNGWDITNNSRYPTAFGEQATDAVDRVMQALSTATEDGTDQQNKNARTFRTFAVSVGEAMNAMGPGYDGEMKRAAAAFAAAHPDEPVADVAQLLPFLKDKDKLIAAFRPVLARLDYAQKHGGEMPTSAEQLQPYLSRPFAPAEAFRTLKLQRDGDALELNLSMPSESEAKR